MKEARAEALPSSLSQARAYCHSRASVPFMRSTLPFCQGLRGLVYLCLMPWASSGALNSPDRQADPLSVHHALHGDPEALVERDRPPHEGAGRLLPLVGQLLGVGDPAVVVDGHARARRPGGPPRPAAAPEGPVPALGYAQHLLDVDVDQLPGALALVAHARDGAAGGVRDAHAAAHALAEQRPFPRGQPCVRMLGHGRSLLTVCLDNSQHAGGPLFVTTRV